MFDIGFPELVMIAVIALLVIGPDKLPGVARTAGKWVGRARRFVTDVKTDIDRELKQEELRKALAEDAGLDEIKQIMNSDNFTIDEDDTPSYQVKAIPDDSDVFEDDDYKREQDEELKHITDHSDAADSVTTTDSTETDLNTDKETTSKNS